MYLKDLCRILKKHGMHTDIMHESMVDNLADPSVYVLSAGSDNQAYPEFLITLRYRGE